MVLKNASILQRRLPQRRIVSPSAARVEITYRHSTSFRARLSRYQEAKTGVSHALNCTLEPLQHKSLLAHKTAPNGLFALRCLLGPIKRFARLPITPCKPKSFTPSMNSSLSKPESARTRTVNRSDQKAGMHASNRRASVAGLVVSLPRQIANDQGKRCTPRITYSTTKCSPILSLSWRE